MLTVFLVHQIYDKLYRKTKRAYNKFATAGSVGRNYASIFKMIMKLRQAALHPSLIKVSEDSDSDDSDLDDVDDKKNDQSVDPKSARKLEVLRQQFDSGEGGSTFPKEALAAFMRGEFIECGE